MTEPVIGRSGHCRRCGCTGEYLDWPGMTAIDPLREDGCPDCHKRFRRSWHRAFIVYVPGAIEPVEPVGIGGYGRYKIRPLTWKLVRENGRNYVYFPCPYCGEVNQMPAADFRYDGFLAHEHAGEIACVNCSHCRRHFWSWLEDFEPVGGSHGG